MELLDLFIAGGSLVVAFSTVLYLIIGGLKKDLRKDMATQHSDMKQYVNTRIDDLKGEINTRIDDLKGEMNTRFDAVGRKLFR